MAGTSSERAAGRARARRRTSAACIALGLALAAGAQGERADGGPHAAAARGAGDVQDAQPRSGRDVYARVIANRFESFVQEARMASGDRAGRSQETRVRMHFKDFRDAQDRPVEGVVSKTLVKYTYPFDLRHSGYLVIQNHDRMDDQFLYFPARRQTRRVNLRGKAIFGTDFSFEDILPRELGDATYERLPDETLGGVPVYVVDAVPTESFDSEYSRFRFYVDRERFVPLRTRYWDAAGVEVKELRAERETMERFGDVWVPMRSTMRHLQLDSYTTFRVTRLVPNPDLDPTTFDLRRLEAH